MEEGGQREMKERGCQRKEDGEGEGSLVRAELGE